MFEIVNLIRQPSLHGFTDVVTGVHWKLDIDIDGEVFPYESFVHLDSPEPSTYIPYNLLSKEEILEWISSRIQEDMLLHIDKVNGIIADRLITQQERQGLPWAQEEI